MDSFWNLFEEMKNYEDYMERSFITEKMMKMNLKEIVLFHKFFKAQTQLIMNNEKVYKEFEKIFLGNKGNWYYYFSAWAVSRGKDVFDDILKNPENMKIHTGERYSPPARKWLHVAMTEVGNYKLDQVKNGTMKDNSVRLLFLYNGNLMYQDLYKYFKKAA